MKATGIVRRIDDLGRVVIPKEIRRTMRIREGDPLEIYTTKDGEVIFKKYSLLGGLEDFAAQFCDTLSHSTEFTAAVTDRDAIIAVAGVGKRELLGKTISEPLERIMERFVLRPEELLVVDDLKPGHDMARAAGVPFAAAGWANDIPEIEQFMRKNCDHYCKQVSDLARLLEEA
mgnify:CR=1 FL=1